MLICYYVNLINYIKLCYSNHIEQICTDRCYFGILFVKLCMNKLRIHVAKLRKRNKVTP